MQQLSWPVVSAFAVGLVGTLLSGCGSDDEPVAFSAPIGINIKVESGDVKSGNTISNEKGITTESGNPWAKFVTDATTALSGTRPGSVRLTSATMLMAATSTGVNGFEEVFTGEVVVQFQFSDSNNIVPVAKLMNPTGGKSSALPLTVVFDYAQISSVDLDRFYNGSYKVVLAGPAATTFMAKGAKVDTQLTFTFEAHAPEAQ